LAQLGYPAQALRRSHELLAASHHLFDPLSTAGALFLNSALHSMLLDSQTCMERAEELISIAGKHGMPFFLALATFHQGWALAFSGRPQEGLAEMREALPAFKTRGGMPFTILCLMLAEACDRNGQPGEGLRAIAEGLASAEESEERVAEPELHRLRGELLLKQDHGAEAEAEQCFRTAIEISRHQSQRLFELRATASFARLLRKQGKPDEARKMLSEIYLWFTEGFDTADLKDAKALLDELSG
jgi:predicted ATPase